MSKPQIDVRDKGFKNLPTLPNALRIVFEKINPMELETIDIRTLDTYQLKILAEDARITSSPGASIAGTLSVD